MIYVNVDEFEVLDKGKVLVVYLDRCYYSCRSWQVNDISCKHVASCISYMRRDSVPYIDQTWT